MIQQTENMGSLQEAYLWNEQMYWLSAKRCMEDKGRKWEVD